MIHLDPTLPIMASLEKTRDSDYIYRYYLLVNLKGLVEHHAHRVSAKELEAHRDDLFIYITTRDGVCPGKQFTNES